MVVYINACTVLWSANEYGEDILRLQLSAMSAVTMGHVLDETDVPVTLDGMEPIVIKVLPTCICILDFVYSNRCACHFMTNIR